MNEDRNSEIKAIFLLENSLSGIGEFPENSGIDKGKLVAMYMESRDIVRQNLDDLKLFRVSNSLCRTCVRVVRCSGVIGEQSRKLFIGGETYSPEARRLYEQALKLYSEFQVLKEC